MESPAVDGANGGTNKRQGPFSTFKVERPVSAGGVVYRVMDGRVEFVLCGRIVPAIWALAKGTPDKGESLEQTAMREVKEETGLEVTIEAPLGNVKYWFASGDHRVRYHKTVYFYLMKYIGGATELHDLEFDEVRWFSSEEAAERLTYANESRMLDKALSLISG